MNIVKKVIIFILFLIVIFKTAPQTYAVVFPECKWNEIQATCQCPHSDTTCADNSCSACLQYKNDPRYYYLWMDIYCRKASVLELIDKFKYSFVLPLFITIILKLIVFVIKKYRKTRDLLFIVLVNCLSVFLGLILLYLYSVINGLIQKSPILSSILIPNIAFTLFGMNVPRLVSLLVVGALIIVFETLFLVHVAKFADRKQVFRTVLMANVISLVLGLGTLNALYPSLLLPRFL